MAKRSTQAATQLLYERRQKPKPGQVFEVDRPSSSLLLPDGEMTIKE
jgi:hypothetical protein